MYTQRAGELEWPSVTVIIPVFNEERSITACLQSVVAQDYRADRMEIIVVDGMSTDRTRDIVYGFAEQDNRIRLLPSPKRHTPCSMNIGVAAAAGEVLVRVDGHSVITGEHVRRCVSLLQRSGADHVGGLMRQRGRTYLARTIALALSSPVGVGSARFRYTDKEQDIDTVPFGAFHRDTLLRLGGFDEAFPVGQDSELDYRITLCGGHVRIDPSISTDYFCRESIPALARQFFRYGRAKAQILHKHGGLPSPRSLVPAAFLTTISVLTLSASVSLMARQMLAVTLAAYSTLCVAAAMVIGAKCGWRHIPLLPAVFAVLHISHGAGFLSFMPRFLAPRPLDRLHGSLAISRSSPSTSAMTQQPAEHAPQEAAS
jgi:cellulose synthase/poly-beta-1,6-N-acetylglucosamine synthase-like glycosyltransferase